MKPLLFVYGKYLLFLEVFDFLIKCRIFEKHFNEQQNNSKETGKISSSLLALTIIFFCFCYFFILIYFVFFSLDQRIWSYYTLYNFCYFPFLSHALWKHNYESSGPQITSLWRDRATM